MIVLVMTGGLGSGKSTAAEYFRSLGAVTIDLDDIAAQVLVPGSAELAQVAETFGTEILRPDRTLDRRRLAELAFATPEATRALDAIVHPAVARQVGPAIADLRLLPNPPEVVVIEVPLLVEAPVFAELADVVLALSAPTDVRVARAVERGLQPADAVARVSRQASDEERAALADAVVANDGTLDEFRGDLAAFWQVWIASGVGL